tara:strand:- start:28063 stop:28182 length:120 start_codon:yes stop_codon:yes gene_type:complete
VADIYNLEEERRKDRQALPLNMHKYFKNAVIIRYYLNKN